MRMPYICKNTIVRLPNGKEGFVIGADTALKVATIKSDKVFCTESIKNLVVISYKGVE